jgi:hypothetical protein
VARRAELAQLAGLLDLAQHMLELDLLRKSGEFPISYEELDDTAATVYEGI